MKLTIKKKTQQKNQQIKLQLSSNNTSKYLQHSCCQLSNEGSRHVIVLPHNKQEKVLYNLVKIDCQAVYSKLSTRINVDGLFEVILKTLAQFQVRYSSWIGYLCAHCYHHFQNSSQRFSKILQFVQKFRVAFEQNRCISSIQSQTFKRIKMHCTDTGLTALNPSDESLKKICKKYQQTLLLQYIPIEYSKYIIERYLSQDGDIQQYVRLCTSVNHFVLGTTNPINQNHFLRIMLNPYMGIVQWPIIIANRHMFQSQPTNSPLYQNS